MKRRKLDGLSPDGVGREPIASEVHVTVIAHRRRELSIGWRLAALTIAVLAATTTLLAMTLASGGGHGRPGRQAQGISARIMTAPVNGSRLLPVRVASGRRRDWDADD
jgi:hypothetical protein